MELIVTTTTNPDGELRTILTPLMFKAEAVVFTELVDGAASGAGWVLNRGDDGLLKSLDRLSCHDASAVAPGGEGLDRGPRRSPLLRPQSAESMERRREECVRRCGLPRELAQDRGLKS
jgi:hypothetical protein